MGGATSSINQHWKDSGQTVIKVDGSHQGIKVAQAVAKVIQGSTTITKLILKDNMIGDDGVILLLEALKGNTTLQELAIPHNGITAKGAKEIAKWLSGNKTLKILHLFDNQIGDEAVIEILDSLKDNQVIEMIQLMDTAIGDSAGAHAVQFLKSTQSLTHFILYGNKFGPTVAHDLLEAASKCPNMQTLGIDDKVVAESGWKPTFAPFAPE